MLGGTSIDEKGGKGIGFCGAWLGERARNHGIHLTAWDKICLPKSRGGLGFRKTKEMNQGSTPILVEDWCPPLQDWIKLNCDVKVELESSCVAVVAIGHFSEVAWVNTTTLDFSDALCSEAASCCLALDMTKLKGYKFIIMESDSRVVINSLN
uniref:RNase H type-1 domain-containing protein n=1 Tax=Cannabis sativa TaxID=3483 RepID=A0A803NZD3_CANSA